MCGILSAKPVHPGGASLDPAPHTCFLAPLSRYASDISTCRPFDGEGSDAERDNGARDDVAACQGGSPPGVNPSAGSPRHHERPVNDRGDTPPRYLRVSASPRLPFFGRRARVLGFLASHGTRAREDLRGSVGPRRMRLRGARRELDRPEFRAVEPSLRHGEHRARDRAGGARDGQEGHRRGRRRRHDARGDARARPRRRARLPAAPRRREPRDARGAPPSRLQGDAHRDGGRRRARARVPRRVSARRREGAPACSAAAGRRSTGRS